MVEFNDRSTGVSSELGAHVPHAESHHHMEMVGHISRQYKLFSKAGKRVPQTATDALDTAYNSVMASTRAHEKGDMTSAQANMHGASAYMNIAAEQMGAGIGAGPLYDEAAKNADKAADTNDDYIRKTNGPAYMIKVARFNNG